MSENYVRVTFEENKTIEVKSDDPAWLRSMINSLTEKFFPNTPWTENDV